MAQSYHYLVSIVGAKFEVQQISMRVSCSEALTIWRPFTVKHGSVTLTFNLPNNDMRYMIQCSMIEGVLSGAENDQDENI